MQMVDHGESNHAATEIFRHLNILPGNLYFWWRHQGTKILSTIPFPMIYGQLVIP